MTSVNRRDLIILTADKDMEYALMGILEHHNALRIRPLTFDIRRHPQRDCGCRCEGVDFLSSFADDYHHALMLFDHEGCGQESDSPETIEANLQNQLNKLWNNRAQVIVIAPELDIWVWSDSPHVEDLLGWRNHTPGLKTWLKERSFLPGDSVKPVRPKEALEAALREIRQPRTSALYQKLAQKVSLSRCSDRAFNRLKTVLHNWFGLSSD